MQSLNETLVANSKKFLLGPIKISDRKNHPIIARVNGKNSVSLNKQIKS